MKMAQQKKLMKLKNIILNTKNRTKLIILLRNN